MAMITVRDLPDEVHRALQVRAALHGRSTEAEVCEILTAAVKPEERVRMGDALAELGRRAGLTNEDFAVFDQVRDKTPADRIAFLSQALAAQSLATSEALDGTLEDGLDHFGAALPGYVP